MKTKMGGCYTRTMGPPPSPYAAQTAITPFIATLHRKDVEFQYLITTIV